MNTHRRRFAIGCLGLVGILMVMSLIQNAVEQRGGTTTPPATSPAASPAVSMTLEEQLALIDNGSLAGAEGKAALYASLLGALSPHCVESRQQIGDMAANAREIVKDRTGRTESIEGILRGWRDAASSLGPDAKCSDVLAGMLVLMTK